jgi:hypothetical protein
MEKTPKGCGGDLPTILRFVEDDPRSRNETKQIAARFAPKLYK